eukprot:5942986-Amphidinium_carterae.2
MMCEALSCLLDHVELSPLLQHLMKCSLAGVICEAWDGNKVRMGQKGMATPLLPKILRQVRSSAGLPRKPALALIEASTKANEQHTLAIREDDKPHDQLWALSLHGGHLNSQISLRLCQSLRIQSWRRDR